MYEVHLMRISFAIAVSDRSIQDVFKKDSIAARLRCYGWRAWPGGMRASSQAAGGCVSWAANVVVVTHENKLIHAHSLLLAPHRCRRVLGPVLGVQ